MPTLLKRLLQAAAALVCLSSGATFAAAYSNVYVFGDSLADSGNDAIVFDTYFGGARTATPLGGPDIPDFPYASGRYTNGPVWTEYLAASLGLSAAPSLAGGTNFAFAGARTGPAGSSFPYSMTDQVGMFLAATGGMAPPSALYVVEGGGNDARDVLTAALGGADSVVLAAMVNDYVNNVLGILMRLATAGADQFLLWNVPDIGKIPAILAIDSVNPGTSAAASGLVSLMNQALALGLTQLAMAQPSVVDGVHLFDADQVLDAVTANPAAFGFTNAADPCAMSPACIADPSGYFFWDGIHPTTAGHAMMARLALAEIPEPQTIALLALGLIALVGFRRRAG